MNTVAKETKQRLQTFLVAGGKQLNLKYQILYIKAHHTWLSDFNKWVLIHWLGEAEVLRHVEKPAGVKREF